MWTREGIVRAMPGDAIVTGTAGQQWPVPRQSFERRYQVQGVGTMGGDGNYLSRALPALALHMTRPFTVLLADGVSRLEGQQGDWLLDYGDGNLGVVADAILRVTYEFTD